MELWLRPPTTAISVLKFCSCRSFWGTKKEGEGGVTEWAWNLAQLFWRGGSGYVERGDLARLAIGGWGEGGVGQHLCHVDEVCDDQGPLRGCGLAENHELNPLRDTVEEGDESFQDRVVHGAAMSHETVIVLELGARAESAVGGPPPQPWPLLTLPLPFDTYTETAHPLQGP